MDDGGLIHLVGCKMPLFVRYDVDGCYFLKPDALLDHLVSFADYC